MGSSSFLRLRMKYQAAPTISTTSKATSSVPKKGSSPVARTSSTFSLAIFVCFSLFDLVVNVRYYFKRDLNCKVKRKERLFLNLRVCSYFKKKIKFKLQYGIEIGRRIRKKKKSTKLSSL